jgi:hypothetical protein
LSLDCSPACNIAQYQLIPKMEMLLLLVGVLDIALQRTFVTLHIKSSAYVKIDYPTKQQYQKSTEILSSLGFGNVKVCDLV